MTKKKECYFVFYSVIVIIRLDELGPCGSAGSIDLLSWRWRRPSPHTHKKVKEVTCEDDKGENHIVSISSPRAVQTFPCGCVHPRLFGWWPMWWRHCKRKERDESTGKHTVVDCWLMSGWGWVLFGSIDGVKKGGLGGTSTIIESYDLSVKIFPHPEQKKEDWIFFLGELKSCCQKFKFAALNFGAKFKKNLKFKSSWSTFLRKWIL